MIYVLARAEIMPEKFSAYVEELHKLVPQVRAEDGCLGYDPCVDLEGEGVGRFITIVEKWASKEHWLSHMQTAHMAEFRRVARPWRINNTVYAVTAL